MLHSRATGTRYLAFALAALTALAVSAFAYFDPMEESAAPRGSGGSGSRGGGASSSRSTGRAPSTSHRSTSGKKVTGKKTTGKKATTRKSSAKKKTASTKKANAKKSAKGKKGKTGKGTKTTKTTTGKKVTAKKGVITKAGTAKKSLKLTPRTDLVPHAWPSTTAGVGRKHIPRAGPIGTASRSSVNLQFRRWEHGKDPAFADLGRAGRFGLRLNGDQLKHLNGSIDQLRQKPQLSHHDLTRLTALHTLRTHDQVLKRIDHGRVHHLRWWRHWWPGLIPFLPHCPGPTGGCGLIIEGGGFIPVGGCDWCHVPPQCDCILPGIEPYYPAYEIPCAKTGGCCVTQVIPGSLESFCCLAEGEDPAAVEAVSDEEAEVRKFCTRFLRVGNATEGRVTFYLRYNTAVGIDEPSWSPAGEEDWLKLVLKPGDVFDVYDGDWRVNTDRVLLWAESEGGRKWLANEEEALLLVPEVEEGGKHCYLAPACDTYVYTVTPKSLKAAAATAGR